jgi:glycosidase
MAARRAHYAFWQGKDVPASWKKFRDITQFWLAQGVDGFRYDMAEMVPVEFWSYLNSAIKHSNSQATLLAEVYNPKQYRDYVHLGKMDYLYDKVDFYDHLKLVMQGKASTDRLADIQTQFADIEHHLLHFLENHDEQRIASAPFAGDARKGLPWCQPLSAPRRLCCISDRMWVNAAMATPASAKPAAPPFLIIGAYPRTSVG